MGKCGRTNSGFVHQRLRVDRTFFAWRNCRTVMKRVDSWLWFNKKKAYENGALGSGISGSGPSILHWVKEKKLQKNCKSDERYLWWNEFTVWNSCIKSKPEYELFKNEYLVLMPVAKAKNKD
jgi:4-diphosphocytidyl-2C-methyl-D-erythritol kinase